MTEQNIETIVKLWTEKPAVAATQYPDGLTYSISKGDTLATLAKKFGLEWKEIASATMGTSEPNEINSWLSSNGGTKVGKYWAFAEGQHITIPLPPGAKAAAETLALNNSKDYGEGSSSAEDFSEGMSYEA